MPAEDGAEGTDSRDPSQVGATGSAPLRAGKAVGLLQGKKGWGREGKGVE